jgi:hypothetical protein
VLISEIVVTTMEIFLYMLCVGSDPRNLSFVVIMILCLSLKLSLSKYQLFVQIVNNDIGYTPPAYLMKAEVHMGRDITK